MTTQDRQREGSRTLFGSKNFGNYVSGLTIAALGLTMGLGIKKLHDYSEEVDKQYDQIEQDIDVGIANDGFVDQTRIGTFNPWASHCGRMVCHKLSSEDLSNDVQASIDLGRCSLGVDLESSVKDGRISDVVSYDISLGEAHYSFQNHDDLTQAFGSNPCATIASIEAAQPRRERIID